MLLNAAALAMALTNQAGGLSEEVMFRKAAILTYFDYSDCVRDKAVSIALSDAKSAPRTIAESAAPTCGKERDAFSSVFLGNDLDPTAKDKDAVEYFQSLAIGAASTAVVEERIGSCGTSLGPYQCKGHARVKRVGRR